MPTETQAGGKRVERGICPAPFRSYCPPWIAAGVLAAVLWPCPLLDASETDWLPPADGAFSPVREAALTHGSGRRAAAMARFANALFLEESHGPESALPEYIRSLDSDPGNMRLALDVAREYLRRAEPLAALEILRRSAENRPSDYLPQYLLAEIYFHHLQDPARAIRYSRKAMALGPGVFAPVDLLWTALAYSGQSSKASALLADVAGNPAGKDARYWFDFAALHRRLPLDGSSAGKANRERMRAALRRVRELAGENAEILAGGGDLAVVSGWPALAVDFYSEAHKLDPSLPSLSEKLAATLLENGLVERAVPVLEKILENNPANLAVCDQLGTIALGGGDLEAGLRYRQRALPIAAPSAARRMEIVQLLLRMGRTGQAAAEIETAREKYPGSAIFTYLLAVTRLDERRPREALELFKTAETEAVTAGAQDLFNADFYFQSGVAAEQSGEISDAAERLKKCIAMDPANAARAENYLGYMWAVRGQNLTEAEKLILGALEKEPRNPAYMDSLGWVYFQQGRHADALVKILRASELMPAPDPEVFEHLGDTYKKLGRSPEAVLFWQKSLQLNPGNSALAEKIDAATAPVAARHVGNGERAP